MPRLELDLDDLTSGALKRIVKQLLMAEDGQEKAILNKLSSSQKTKNELADLDEEMHGKPKTPTVEKDDLPEEDDE